MRCTVTISGLVAGLFLLPSFASAQFILDTGAIRTEVFDDGFIGTDPTGNGIGFNFNGENGLRVGTALVGIGGSSDTQPYEGSSEFTNVSPTTAITPDGEFDYYDVGWATSFSSPLGVTLHQEAYALSGSNDRFVVFNLCAENTSGGPLDVYIGYFADWDVGNPAQNMGSLFSGSIGEIVYTWDDSGKSPNHLGIARKDGTDLSGWTTDSTADDVGQFQELSTRGAASTEPGDRRNVAGGDLGTLVATQTRCAVFVWAAGADLDELRAAVLEATPGCGICPAIEPNPDGTPGTHNLSLAYPNPFNPQARFTLEVAEYQDVHVAVFDALGREIVLLYDGPLSAGREYTYTISGAGLPSGVYLIRADGEHFSDARQVTLLK